MPTIQVVKPFTLQHDPLKRKMPDPMDSTKQVEETLPSEMQFFDVGIYEVAEHVATHWYVKAHLKGYEPPKKTPGMAEYQVAQAVSPAKPDQAQASTDPTQPMPSDASEPRRAPLPPSVTRAEPIA